jgi:O-antigen/teichoic acid export membrane protein
MKQPPMDPGMARALRSNGVLNLVGLGASFLASAWMVRSMDPGSYAQLGVVSAMVGVVGFVAEAGGNAGFSRFYREAESRGFASGFYSGMLRRRLRAGLFAALLVALLGPWYARWTGFVELRDSPWLFAGVGALCGTTLGKWLPHYGLMAMLEPGTALGLQHGFMVLRSVCSGFAGAAGAGVGGILGIWLGVALVEAWCFHRKFTARLPRDSAALSSGFVGEVVQYGLHSTLDKACAMLGGGSVLVLFFAARYGTGNPAADLAYVALGYEVTGKILGLTVMPMANLVTPYLSRVAADPVESARAAGGVCSLSAFLYALSIGGAFVLTPLLLPLFYGQRMEPASAMVQLILVPMALEAWARGVVSPVLLRNGEPGALFRLNAGQLLATVGSVWATWNTGLEEAVLWIGSVRGGVALCGLIWLRKHLVSGTLRRVAWIAAGTGLAAVAAEWIRRDAILGRWGGALAFAGLSAAGIGTLLGLDTELRNLVARLFRGVAGVGMQRWRVGFKKGGRRGGFGCKNQA